MKYGYILVCAVVTCVLMTAECKERKPTMPMPKPKNKEETKAAVKEMKKVVTDVKAEVKKQADYLKKELCKDKDIGPLALKEIASDLEDETCNKAINLLKASVKKQADGIRNMLCKEKTFGSNMLKEIAKDLSTAKCTKPKA